MTIKSHLIHFQYFSAEHLLYVLQYWMGTHQKGPSMIVDNDGTVQHSLEDMIRNHPKMLGKEVIEAFGGGLPFLFKVLSVNKALSIQVCEIITTVQ